MVLDNSDLIKECPIDEHINSWKSLTCENCGGDLSLVSPKKPAPEAQSITENDWKCPGCGLENSSATNKCFECFHPKELGATFDNSDAPNTAQIGTLPQSQIQLTNYKKVATLCFEGQEFEIDDGLVVGRDPNLSKIAHFLSSRKNVSRAHARFLIIDKEYYVEDLDSTNGTRVNMFLIPSGAKHKLEHLDKVAFSSDFQTEVKIK